MNWNFKIDKNRVQVYSRVFGLCCLFFILFNQGSKSNKFISQELPFWISITGIILLSISLNLKLKGKNDEKLNFFQRNTPLILGITMALIMSIFWITNNYINI